ncbi:Uma2 family endonuclease [Synechococcus sp. PCC 7336]|uniref:Uma2 family endonuclease n=1 Tax=Synechococcus sp. PCC 7336 TaxID=195250 RepID=UPI000348A2A7|nr:Uma2 family endonuclease [Synechococcus sp. PCC 7336]
MFAVVTPDRLQLPPGAVVRLPGTWDDYQQLTQQRGDRALPRLKYRAGEILLMVPLPDHGRKVHMLAAIAMAVLDSLERDCEAFTPITMALPQESGIEPDYCLYIEHWQAVAGKDRMDWRIDPPPDLAIEVDVTSYTDVNDYLIYRVPEVWLLKEDELVVYRLEGDRYVARTDSRYFAIRNIPQIVSESLQAAYNSNTSAASRHLRRQLETLS